jgi:hypothetical protein
MNLERPRPPQNFYSNKLKGTFTKVGRRKVQDTSE